MNSILPIKSFLNKALNGPDRTFAVLGVPLSFTMIVSPTGNQDNFTFSPNLTLRHAVTESEMQATDTLLTVADERIGIDKYFRRPLSLRETDIEMVDIDGCLITGEFSNYDLHDIMIVIREEMVQHPVSCRYGSYRLHYDPREALEGQGFSKIYDCASVSAFVK